MASSTPFGAIAQKDALVEGMERGIHDDEKQNHQNTERSTSIDTSLDEKKGVDEGFDSSSGQEHVAALARTFTEVSAKNESGEYINPFNGSADPALDPKSGKFNATKWVKTLIGISSRDPERYPKRTAGISYKNLNVHGFGNPTDYRKQHLRRIFLIPLNS